MLALLFLVICSNVIADDESDTDVSRSDMIKNIFNNVLIEHSLEMKKIPGRNFEIGEFEISQKQWKAVMGNNPSKFSSCGENCPVENISADDVQAFINKLNKDTNAYNEDEDMSSGVYRLPTEEEWKYACYGGSQTEYCGSNNLDAVGWYDGNSNMQTHPAGQKQANGYGLYDMTGNVWEWTNDCWKGDCAKRVIRGGSWFDLPQRARSADSGGIDATRRSGSIGFRLVRTPL